MSRSLPEWIGKTPDQAIPPRVRLRVFERTQGRCAICTRQLRPRQWDCDHRVALVNGGEHRERNLVPVCTDPCHRDKSKNDVAEKSSVYRRKLSAAGIRKRKTPMRGWRRFDGTPVRNPKLAQTTGE